MLFYVNSFDRDRAMMRLQVRIMSPISSVTACVTIVVFFIMVVVTNSYCVVC